MQFYKGFKNNLVLFVAVVAVLSVSASAGTIYVDASGTGDYPTIQSAIDDANEGDTVLVADGVYTGEGNRDIDFLGKAVTVRSENGPNNCIIDCENSGRGFYFHSGEDANSILAGFTITGGAAVYGGGIYCENSSPTITNCVISDNYAMDYYYGLGGGIACLDSNATISNCTISGNTAMYGGGIYCNHSSPTITNCNITSNSAVSDWFGPGWGGGIYCRDSNAVITKCTISGNISDNGGGISCDECNPVIINCIISGNLGRNIGGGIFCWESNAEVINCTISGNVELSGHGGGIFNYWESKLTVTNCIVWGNLSQQIIDVFDTASVTYSNVEGGWPGNGNIDEDPCFVQPGYWDTNGLWFDGDYHLLQDSPCMNAGDPDYVPEPNETDLDGWPRVIGGRVDMGAYEFFLRIEVAMRFTPQAMNPKSKGKWLKAHIVLPEGFSVGDVDTNEPVVAQVVGLEIEADHVEVFVNVDGFVEIEVAFERTAFCGIAAADDIVEVTVEGQFTDGHHFYGTDTIRIVPRNFSSYLAALSSHWLRTGCGPPDWCSGLDFDQDGVINFADFALFDRGCIEVLEE